MQTQTIAAKPAKLLDGSWGARPSADVKVGDILTITTRAGKSWAATVTEVLSNGTVATQSLDRTTSRRPARSRTTRRVGKWTGCSCGSREQYDQTVPSPQNCSSCQFEAVDQ